MLSGPPPISVLMPSFNGARYVAEAIQSIRDQTFRDYEFIIVDDHSTDGSWDIILSCARQDPRIVAVRNDRNLRICETLNRGLGLSQAPFIVRMDSDDVALPLRLARLHRFMSDPGNDAVGVCGSFCLVINEAGVPLGTKAFPVEDEEIRRSFWRRNPIQHSAAIIRRACFKDLGLYDGAYLLAEDLDLWMRFGRRWRLANIPEVLLKYRVSSTSSILAHQKEMMSQSIRVRRDGAIKYGYGLSWRARAGMATMALMRLLPPRLVFRIFMRSIRALP